MDVKKLPSFGINNKHEYCFEHKKVNMTSSNSKNCQLCNTRASYIQKDKKYCCSKRRPDILIDLETHLIIIEVDENQHKGYSCENKRIMEISQDLGHPNFHKV